MVQFENKELGEGKELDLTALDKLEKQVIESGNAFKQSNMGTLPAQEMGELDPNEQNY